MQIIKILNDKPNKYKDIEYIFSEMDRLGIDYEVA